MSYATDCGKTCTGGCGQRCVGSCNNTCEKSSWLGCGWNCQNYCTNSCSGTCNKKCQDTCDNDCKDTCKTGCRTTCKWGCGGSCTGKCGGCDTGCSSCTGTCSGGCKVDCKGKCETQCINGAMESIKNLSISANEKMLSSKMEEITNAIKYEIDKRKIDPSLISNMNFTLGSKIDDVEIQNLANNLALIKYPLDTAFQEGEHSSFEILQQIITNIKAAWKETVAVS